MNGNEFTKYVPPHMRRKERRKERRSRNRNHNRNEKKKDEQVVDLQNKSLFPVLNEECNVVNNSNENWLNESKRVPMIKKENNTQNKKFNIGSLEFKVDTDVQKGWVVLSKDKNENRGNCSDSDLVPSSYIERKMDYEHYISMVQSLSRNSEGIPLIPKHSTPFDYDTDEDIAIEQTENLDYEFDENENEEFQKQEYYSDNSDYDDY